MQNMLYQQISEVNKKNAENKKTKEKALIQDMMKDRNLVYAKKNQAKSYISNQTPHWKPTKQ